MSMTYGRCANCAHVFSPDIILGHLRDCIPNGPGKKQGWYMLQVFGSRDHWMYLAVSSSAVLLDLDLFLREIWLECCGHNSTFIVEQPIPNADRNKENPPVHVNHMKTSVRDIFKPGLVLDHEYGAPDVTSLRLRVLSQHKNGGPDEKIKLLAKNLMPEYTCNTCGNAGTEICMACIHEQDNPMYCRDCAADHREDHRHTILMACNSPRMGCIFYDPPDRF